MAAGTTRSASAIATCTSRASSGGSCSGGSSSRGACATSPAGSAGSDAESQEDPDALTVGWRIDDAPVDDARVLRDGNRTSVAFEVGELAGEVAATLWITDLGGQYASADRAFTILENSPPTVAFVSPEAGEVVSGDGSVPVQIQVSDSDEPDGTAHLSLGWTLDGAALPAGPSAPEADGTARFDLDTASLSPGEHALAVTALDACGDAAEARTAFTVRACGDEVCNGVDDDCDGAVDEPDAVDARTWYADADGDGYGTALEAQTACDAPAGYQPNADDCDDGDAAVHPAATEICDGADNDCDAQVDDDDASLDLGTATTWFADKDADGWGDALDTALACVLPTGFVADDQDCDDTRTDVNPGASEVCDGLDDDCDTLVDDDDPTLDTATASTWYADADGDTWGDPAWALAACTQPLGSVAAAGDCDDATAAVNPAASEVCDSLDNDCDGQVDDDDPSLDATTATTWYADADADGYGDAASPTEACTRPAGAVSDTSDCDDVDDAVNPAASEVCDSVDNDCDGQVDDDDPSLDATTATTWYADADADGWGDPASATVRCTPPADAVSVPDDCDDADDAVNPDETEVCDAIDNDCDGVVDSGSCACAVESYGSHSYLFCTSLTTWPNAEADCLSWGYDLVTIDDSGENSWLTSTGLAYGFRHGGLNELAWHGFNDRTAEGTWEWASGDPASFTSWSGGEPNNMGNEDCATLNYNGTWNDYPCTGSMYYICESP
jgi:hypothetical protein